MTNTKNLEKFRFEIICSFLFLFVIACLSAPFVFRNSDALDGFYPTLSSTSSDFFAISSLSDGSYRIGLLDNDSISLMTLGIYIWGKPNSAKNAISADYIKLSVDDSIDFGHYTCDHITVLLMTKTTTCTLLIHDKTFIKIGV